MTYYERKKKPQDKKQQSISKVIVCMASSIPILSFLKSKNTLGSSEKDMD